MKTRSLLKEAVRTPWKKQSGLPPLLCPGAASCFPECSMSWWCSIEAGKNTSPHMKMWIQRADLSQSGQPRSWDRVQQEHSSRELVRGGTGNGSSTLAAVSSPCPIQALSIKFPLCASRLPKMTHFLGKEPKTSKCDSFQEARGNHQMVRSLKNKKKKK